MTTIEKRIDYIKSKFGYDDDKANFLVKTGLTFNPNAKKKVNNEEKAYKDIDWYNPKGLAFETTEDDSSETPVTPTPDPDAQTAADQQTQDDVNDLVNNADEPVVTTTDPDTGEQTTEPLDPASTVNVVTGKDDDDDDINPDPIADANGELIITND